LKNKEQVVYMSNLRFVIALGVSVLTLALSSDSFAQDDLDALLSALEGEVKSEEKAKSKDSDATAAEAPAAAESAPVEEAKEAPAAEAPAQAPAEPAVAPAATESAAAVVEEPAAAVAEPADKAAAAPVEELSDKEVKKAVEVVSNISAEAASEPADAPASVSAVKPADPDAELVSNLVTTEKLRRQALDSQAMREILSARECMENEEFAEAVRHYGLATKLLNDNPKTKKLRRECSQGICYGVFKAALQEDEFGRREHAIKLMERALELRHPEARTYLERWLAEADPATKETDGSEHRHRINDEDFQKNRELIRKHLRRSRQFLAVRDLDRALEECEVVLVNDPYNQEAIRLRKSIQKKRKVVLQQEREAARDGMIADVDEAWRPVYAVNAAKLDTAAAETVKKQAGEDPERTQEQEIERRMKEMRLPSISFKAPATIMDAVDFFSQASKDYDRPDIPLEKRGFNFVLNSPELNSAKDEEEADSGDDFSASGKTEESSTGKYGLRKLPKISASDITFYEALKIVCDSVEYKFIIRGPMVMVMPRDMSTAEILSRQYNVLEAFLERMTSASSDVKEMKASGFGGGNARANEDTEENQEKDWKAFFEQMGVKWPEGSSIMYIKTLGKLYVRNTRENLAEFEKVLQEMGSQPKLIEIETRFVEVSQEDLNSLGFEWILNSNYDLSANNWLGKALKIGKASYGDKSTTQTYTGTRPETTTTTQTNPNVSGGGTVTETTWNEVQYSTTTKSTGWQKGGDKRNLGINAMGGSSDYGNGNRYLSTVGNHISGENGSANDQFMRVNAFLGSADLSMILHMLSQRSDTDLLSAPKVVTKSGEQAIIKVVTEYIYPQDYDVQLQSSSSGSSGGSSGGGQSAILAVVEPQNFTTKEVGVILDVTPTYSEANGGTIDLELRPAVVDEPVWKNYGMRIPFTGNTSSGTMADIGNIFTGMAEALTSIGAPLSNQDRNTIAGKIVDSAMYSAENVSTSSSSTMTWYDAPMEQPFFHIRSIDSKVSITPGSTVVMGGLITEARKAMDDKVPFLGDLPYLGRFFRSHAEYTNKRNLLIFVTGRLISASGRELQTSVDSEDSEGDVKAAPDVK
jgi:general secretion pathway protein D